MKLLKKGKDMSEHKLTPTEIQFLQEALSSDYKVASIRLREGEYQYELSKTIASFQLELHFPNVKDLIKRLHGEEKINDVQLIRKTQTILKKMEKSGVIKILPKTKPWELQRYALLSLKFIDSDKNHISLATNEQIQQAKEKLKTILNMHKMAIYPTGLLKLRAYMLAFIVVLSYVILVWNLLQPVIDPIVVIGSFSIATVCSITLGKILSHD
ncbi:MAG: hypothetical protein QXP36_13565 [Conexivisphaerales archaeon]